MQKCIVFFILFTLFTHTVYSQDESRVFRFPAIYGDQVVFTFGGDLYTVNSEGGVARKLTSHIGFEIFPKFSPDGRYIAFTGQYDGNTEVYIIPSEGGIPKRLTYTATLERDDLADRMGPNNIVMAWTPDGKNILYRSRKQSFNSFIGQLYSVPVTGGLSKEIPLSTGGFCSYSRDGQKLAFNRVFREFRTWKYYKGGMADDIRIVNLKNGKIEVIAQSNNQDIFPMWIGDEIYFLSDRDRRMNLFVYNLKSGATEKLTDFQDYDIKFPSHSQDYIIYEKGGYLYKFNVKQRKNEYIPIKIADDQLFARSEIKDVSKDIRTADISPNGERVIFGARGEVFSVPAKKGITYNFTQTPGIHERNVSWSPDGQYVSYISDKSGEFEIYIQKQDGSESPKPLTKNADTYIFDYKWSPDSKSILYHDRKFRLRMADIQTGKVIMIDENKYGTISGYDWSPDSKWIVYEFPTDNDYSMIKLFNTETLKKFDVTDNWYHNGSSVFSSDGKYLLFVSAREFNPVYNQIEWNYAYVDMQKIYIVTLSKDTPNPFSPENDIVKPDNNEKTKEKKESDPGVNSTIKVDTDGLQNRITALPLSSSNYFNVRCIGDKVYYLDWKRGSGVTAKMYDLKTKKETELGKNMQYVISANGKKMLVIIDNRYGVIDLPVGKVTIEEPIDLSGLKTNVIYSEEWQQIFDESWRQMRDFFYVENMHGVDWLKMKEKYGELVPFIRHRDDLTYIIGEMIGELNVGHTYINSGERPVAKKIKTGLLGAKLSKHTSGYFSIDEILKGANWDPALRSPLTEIGVDLKAGDFILSINGNSLKDVNDIYSLLTGQNDKPVELMVNSKPTEEGSRKVLVTPVADESGLYYYSWVQKNIDFVSKKTNGEVGYLHIPDMMAYGLNEFVKHFYPQLNKKGLIIDGRGNGGGNVSPMIIERLQRELTRANMSRNRTEGTTVPGKIMAGPKVLIVDQYSASDGDLFPYAFKKHNLGTVVGTRTWGGVVGITASLPFIDGQDLRKPEFASYSSEKSEWIIEGYGVEPDVVIDNDPYEEYKGKDNQLVKAIEIITEQLKHYKPLPPIPPPPDKSK